MTRRIAAAGALALLTAGCTGLLTHHGAYDPKAFAPWRIAADQKLDGRALILTTAAEDAAVFAGPPDGLVGCATTLTLPLGVMAREAALRVFGDLFRGGAEASNDASHLGGYRAVFSPRITKFSYRAWARLELSVHVALLDAAGQVVYETTEVSGEVKASPAANGEGQADVIARSAQVTVQALLLRAAAGVKSHLEAPRATGGQPPAGREGATRP